MQIRLLPLLLMMVSSATAVLPVWRSPMISSRCPRPIGIMVSMALIPVAMGSRTGWRSITPGAMRSSGDELVGGDRALVVDGLAERIHHAADHGVADGTLMMRPVRLTSSPSLISVYSPSSTDADLVFFQVHGDAGDAVRETRAVRRP